MPPRLISAAATCLLLSSTAPLAQANRPAELQMVTKGVFAMDVGKSIDLTDRGILLRLIEVGQTAGEPASSIQLSINGWRDAASIGHRYNLKKNRATGEFVKDTDTCVLDVVDASWPKGGTASATFRLMCQ